MILLVNFADKDGMCSSWFPVDTMIGTSVEVERRDKSNNFAPRFWSFGTGAII